MSDTDGQLLKSFAATRDEGAFRLLAKRHLGLIFHTALRRTGNNRPLAEDISQNVLLAMARKVAALAKEPACLPGWLHRATLYEASKAMRAESSYQRRKEQAQDYIAADARDRAWQEALPQLDLALDKLPEADRRLLLLHYFEGHPFPRIAEQMGKNLSAVQKQSQRALEKLSRILRTRGIALSVTALGAGLATQTAKAVPEAFVHSASSFALSTSTIPLPVSVTAMIASKPKVIVPLALLLLATPLVLQQLAIAREKDHLRSLHENLASSNKTISPGEAPRLSRFRSTQISNNLDVMVLAKEQAEAKRIGGEVVLDFTAKLAALDPAVLVDLIQKTSVAPLGLQKKSGLSGALVTALAATDPKLAVTTAIDALGSDSSQARMVAGSDLGIHLASWAEADPAGALAWFREQLHSPRFSSRALSEDPRTSSHIDSLKAPLFAALVTSQASQADDFLRSTPEAERKDLILGSIPLLHRQGGDDWLRPYLRIVRELAPEDSRDDIQEQLALAARREGLLRMLGSAQATPEETEKLARAIVHEELSKAQTRQWQSGGKTPPADLSSLTDWLQQIVPGQAEAIIASSRGELDRERTDLGAKVVRGMRMITGLPDQQFASMLTEHDLSDHLPEALELTEQIKNPELKQKTIDYLKSRARNAEAP